MTGDVVGRGTWYDKMAAEVAKRERRLGRSLRLLRVESGLGASGLPHVGSLADATRSYAVSLALRDQGFNSELVAFSDDLDALRKVPQGFDPSLSKYLGYPVTSIPDPFKCHASFGEHMSSLLLEALDACDVEYTHMSGREVYRSGLLNRQVDTLLRNAERVGEVISEEVGQEKYTEVLPYFAICQNCGRLTTRAYQLMPEERRVLYICDGIELRGRWLKGCGYKGEADYTRGEGKLSWKVEFAARWAALDIRFEEYGKDIADSVRVNDRVCREILGYEPPLHARYEMFLDKAGRKISKSAGNVFTPQVWFRYGSPLSLKLLTLKRFSGTRRLSVVDIPRYMDEFDALEDIYFGRKAVTDPREEGKLRGLYEYCHNLKPPVKPSLHVPYNLLTYLVKVAPPTDREGYIASRLRRYSYLKGEPPAELKSRIEYAANWVRDFEEIRETTVSLSQNEATAIKELIDLLRAERSEEEVQTAIFELARRNGIEPPRFFQTLYRILLGAPQGPRLGPYIIAMGRTNIVQALERALQPPRRATD
ncbi:MAG: lysine--tRNA ligase [Candidatus Bathyarchaeia archaeon]